MKRTYIDANVLIAAFQGEERVAQRALRVLDDPDRKLVVSDYLRLEVRPKPTFHKRQEEIDFMQAVFNGASENLITSSDLTGGALEMASKYDMTPIDALHVGAAAVAGVDEFVTMEKPTKPMCKVKEIKVVSIHSESEAAR
jgi:predicted nucleic acid-binding protein